MKFSLVSVLSIALAITSFSLAYQTYKYETYKMGMAAKVKEYEKNTAELIEGSKKIAAQAETMRLQCVDANEKVEQTIQLLKDMGLYKY